MDRVDQRLLDRLQAHLPVVPRPFATVAAELGLSEDEVLRRIAALHAEGIVRRIGPVLDPARIGRVGILAAMAVPPGRLDAVAAQVSAFEGVTHNYHRVARHGQCPYNLWFTLSATSEEALTDTIGRIAQGTGLAVATLPSRRKFKIAVRFSFSEDGAGG